MAVTFKNSTIAGILSKLGANSVEIEQVAKAGAQLGVHNFTIGGTVIPLGLGVSPTGILNGTGKKPSPALLKNILTAAAKANAAQAAANPNPKAVSPFVDPATGEVKTVNLTPAGKATLGELLAQQTVLHATGKMTVGGMDLGVGDFTIGGNPPAATPVTAKKSKAKGLEWVVSNDIPSNGPTPKAAPDLSAVLGMPVVALREATNMYQRVKGTSGGSVYFVVAMGDGFAIAAKTSHSSVSLRLEGTIPEEAHSALEQNGFTCKGLYWSGHYGLEHKCPPSRLVGAVLVSCGLVFNTPMPNMALEIFGE